jgi:alcohol dehydrogenase, propanol-preferring
MVCQKSRNLALLFNIAEGQSSTSTINHISQLTSKIGSYKQYLRSPERYTTLIPDGVSDYVAGPIMCSASTIYTSLKESELRPGNWAIFPGGGGGVGIQGVQLAAAIGLRPVVVDTGSEKKELSLSLGAEHFVDFKESKDSVAEVVKICDGIGAHGVFVTAPQSYPSALGYLGSRAGGKVMCIALPSAGQFNMTIPPAQLVFRNLQVKGTLVSSMGDVDETLEFAKRGKLRLKPEVVGLSKFNEAVQRLKEGKVAGRIVVDFNME